MAGMGFQSGGNGREKSPIDGFWSINLQLDRHLTAAGRQRKQSIATRMQSIDNVAE